MKLEPASTALGDLAEVRQLEFEMISGDGVNYVLSATIALIIATPLSIGNAPENIAEFTKFLFPTEASAA